MNNLPKYWVVKNDGSQLFKDTVIKYLNTKGFTGEGSVQIYYGFDGNKYNKATNCWEKISSFERNPTEEFTRGELVEVRDHNSNSWNKRIFLTEIHWSEYPFICVDVNKVNEFKVNEVFSHQSRRFCRKIETKKERLVMMTDEEYNLFIKDWQYGNDFLLDNVL